MTKIHVKGELAYHSKALGIPVYHTLCGASNDIKATAYPNDGNHADLVTCTRCLRSFAFNRKVTKS